MRRLVPAVAALAMSGCFEAPPRAPDDLEALLHFLFREWDNETPSVMQEGVAKLDALASAVDTSRALHERSFALEPVTREDLAGIAWPSQRDPARTLGVAVARRSRWPVDDHARFQSEGDILEAEPSTKSYSRRFPGMADPSCFRDRRCAELDTVNDIVRSNFAMTVHFVQQKRFRWVADGTRWAIVARAWTERSYPGEDEGTALHQSYTMDALMGTADGRTLRCQAGWSESETGVTDRDILLDILAAGTDSQLNATDEVIGGRYHGE